MQTIKARDFASQINLYMENCWGMVKAVLDLVGKMEDGKYLLLRDPNKPVMRIYQVPADEFDRSHGIDA